MTYAKLAKAREFVRQKFDPCFEYSVNHFVPWTPLAKPLSQCRVALVSSAGVHSKDDQPFDADNPLGDCTFREIPSSAAPGDLAIAHSHYDHRYADEDLNCVFPLWRLGELATFGTIGELAAVNYSFMGFIPEPLALVADTAPRVARDLRQAGVDAVFLNPV